MADEAGPQAPAPLWITGDPAADDLLAQDDNALLIGMVLDQQVPMEKAFAGPAVIAERMGGRLDVAAIAAMEEEQFVALCAERPAIHRFPGSMGKRVHQVCRVLVADFDAEAANVWRDAGTGAEVLRAITALPGFGEQKAAIFTAVLGKRRGVRPPGWAEAAGPYGEPDCFRSVADVVDEESLTKVRATKRAAKAGGEGSGLKTREQGVTELLPEAAVRALAGHALTYREVGGTTADQLPPGYHQLELRAPIGYGRRQFEAATEALLRWEMHRRSGLRPQVSDLRVRPDAVAVLRLGVGPLRLRVPVRVLAVVDEPDRQGFVYGTLPGHPERGEESFTVELESDGAVRFRVRAFSRAGRWFTRLGGPVGRAGQRLMTERYVSALHAAAQAVVDPAGV